MKRSDFTGAGKVFRFSLKQMLQSRANIVSLIILLLFALAAGPISMLMSGDSIPAPPQNLDLGHSVSAGSGISQEQQAILSIPYSTSTQTVERYLRSDSVGWEAKFVIQYIYSILVMFLSLNTATYIVRSIVEEKASKLVELLMVSVRPLALILGKILSAMVYVFGMIVMMLLGCALSFGVTERFGGPSLSTLFGQMGLETVFQNLGLGTAAIVFVSLALGYLTFSILAGLAGTSCSSMDEVEGANMIVLLTIMAGYLVSCVTTTMESQAAILFISVCPVVSVFCAPVQYVCGNIGLPTLVLSWVLQAVVLGLLAVLCAKVYQSLLLHRGSKVKFRQMLAMAGLRKEA